MTVSIVHFSIRRLYVYRMTDDTVGAPVYATGVRARCARKLSFERNMATATLEGDGGVCHATREIKSLNFEIDYGGVPLDVNALLMGSTLNEITGPPLASHMIISTDDLEISFGAIAKVLGRNGGAAHVAIFNAREQGGGAVAPTMDAYGTTVLNGIALPSPYDEAALAGIYHRATDVDISTTWASNVVTNLTGSY